MTAIDATDTSTAAFTEAAARLADDINHETDLAGSDHEWLREVVRSANQAVDLVTAARRAAEDRFMAAREATR